MEPLPFVVVLAMMSIGLLSAQPPMETLKDVLVNTVQPRRTQKREATSTQSVVQKRQHNFDQFLEEKLIQHGKALELLLKSVQKNEELTKTLIENIGKLATKKEPKMPEKIEVLTTTPSRRSNNQTATQDRNILLRIGKKVPLYGNLVKHMIQGEVRRQTEPVPLVEKSTFGKQFMTRRTLGGPVEVTPALLDTNKNSPWCTVAMLCERKMDPVCGFDENFGYGKFDDVCHMLQVNCYWKYNFAVAPSCKPTA